MSEIYELMSVVPMRMWGKDHWSTLAYVETRCTDYSGSLDRKHMRSDGNGYPSILQGGKMANHSDWNCLEDLESAELIICLPCDVCKMTELGNKIASELRAYKQLDKNYHEFKIAEQKEEK